MYFVYCSEQVSIFACMILKGLAATKSSPLFVWLHHKKQSSFLGVETTAHMRAKSVVRQQLGSRQPLPLYHYVRKAKAALVGEGSALNQRYGQRSNCAVMGRGGGCLNTRDSQSLWSALNWRDQTWAHAESEEPFIAACCAKAELSFLAKLALLLLSAEQTHSPSALCFGRRVTSRPSTVFSNRDVI